MSVIQLKQRQDYILIVNLKYGIYHEVFGSYNNLLREYMNLIKLMMKNENSIVKLEYNNTSIAFDILSVISFELIKDEGMKNDE